MQFLTNLDLSKNELQNAVIQPLATAPAGAKLGQLYFDTAENALMQYKASGWAKVGVVYDQTASTGAVIAGLDGDGNVTTKNVIELTLTGYTPVDGGVVNAGDALGDAIAALDEGLKDVIAGGGEPNQEAWSYIGVGDTTISASAKKDTFKVAGSGAATVTANASTKTVTVGVNVDSSMSTSSTNPVQNKVADAAIKAAQTAAITEAEGYTDEVIADYTPTAELTTLLAAKADKDDLNDYLKLDGSETMSGALKMGNNKITGLAGGSANTDAATYGQLTSGLAEKADETELADYLKKDGTVAMTGALAMGSHKITGLTDGSADTDAATVGQMETAIEGAVADYLPLSGGTMTGAVNMGGNAISNIPNASADNAPVAYGQLPTTPVMTDASLSYSGDTVTLNKDLLNVKTGATSSDTEVIALANGTTAGLMSPASVNAISNLTSRVESLEGRTVRLLYTAKQNPTAAEIEAFVRAEGYTDPTKWAGIAVVVEGTYHIWHYYASGTAAWRDDGLDTVNQFTNSVAGIIKGSTEDGQVYAEDDGTGSVVGWDDLKSDVADLETNKADKADVDLIPVVKAATGTLAANTTSVSVAYTGTVINTFVKDGSGNEVVTDVAIGASTVTFTVAQAAATALTCVVIYM